MSVVVITTQEDLDELVETKVRDALDRQRKRNRRRFTRPPRRGEKWWMPRFLELLAETGNITEAAGHLQREGGPCRSTVYRTREVDERFSSEWDEVMAGALSRFGPEVADG